MKEFVNVLNSYHLLNYLVPGVIFTLFLKYHSDVNMIQNDIFSGLVLYYFGGMVISRIGSVIIEEFFKWTKLIKFGEYADFVKTSKLDDKIEVLLETRNMYRGLFTMSMITFFICLFDYKSDPTFMALSFFLIIIFFLSWRKQNDYLFRRVEAIKENGNQLN